MALFWRKDNPIRWLRHSTVVIPLFGTPVAQDGKSAKHTQWGSSFNDVTSNMEAPMLDQKIVASLHQALQIDSIVSSIKQLS